MTTKSDYTAEEWLILTKAPIMAALGAMTADPTILSLAKELIAVATIVDKAKQEFAGVGLVSEVLADARRKAPKQQSSGSQQPTVDKVLDHLKATASILRARATRDEARELRRLILWFAEQIAGAGAEGPLGLGKKISPKERAYIRQLETVFGLI